MKLASKDAAALAQEPGLTAADLRVWLLLVDAKLSPTELDRSINGDPGYIGTSCRRLLAAGWIEVAEEIGRVKRYRARATRNVLEALPGQMTLM